jgi:hypothetical protein
LIDDPDLYIFPVKAGSIAGSGMMALRKRAPWESESDARAVGALGDLLVGDVLLLFFLSVTELAEWASRAVAAAFGLACHDV